VDHTTVATAQATQLSTEESALNVTQQRLLNTVSLIGNLGGDWSSAPDDAGKTAAQR
jgi:outer membrane protein TolC